ncbi:type II secretion system F family protein [Mycoavidus sp. SF9855]|uniref:type II secretion system F family protein n=1 Tax=Mycoavidus sp. SF9855 TaxID=2968475 RepID=UPI00211CB6BE|nr:type II secretion system F family protein [Mycoavidus sp. SF9855]UUM21732.1 type II secretion system F family protein [Mycoavidus sp. SF9855]
MIESEAPITVHQGQEFRFSWRGINATGGTKNGVLIATGIGAARALLKQQRITAFKIINQGPAKPAVLRAADITTFSRQLAGLLHAGLPLVAALDVMASSNTRPTLVRVIHALARAIAQGQHFSAALAHYPQFGAMYCQLVAIGEASGALAPLLAQLADQRERAAAQRAKLRAALSYPAGILIVSLLITTALMIWVVPTFKQIFDGFGTPLPVPTRVVLSLSSAMAHCIVPITLLISAGTLLAGIGLRRSTTLRTAYDHFILMPPIIGPLLQQLAITRWSRALGTLLKTGTPLADAFNIMAKVTNNAVFDQATLNISHRVRRGERLANAMRATGCFPPTVLQPIAIAEESGSLDTMLNDLATLNEQQVDMRIATLANSAEPLMIIVLGLLVGGLVVAMYLPIIELGNVI